MIVNDLCPASYFSIPLSNWAKEGSHRKWGAVSNRSRSQNKVIMNDLIELGR